MSATIKVQGNLSSNIYFQAKNELRSEVGGKNEKKKQKNGNHVCGCRIDGLIRILNLAL